MRVSGVVDLSWNAPTVIGWESSENKLYPKTIGSKLGSPLGSGLRSGLCSGSVRARLGALDLLGFVRPRIGSGICVRLAEIGARLGTRLSRICLTQAG